MTPSIGIRDITRIRLASQFLTCPEHATASEIVSALGAVQAQDYAGSKWAIAQRTTGLTDAAIEREITDGRILRTHLLRPTWHFVAQADIRWMLALTGPRISASLDHFDRRLGLDAAAFRKTNALIARALEGGHHLTRGDLAKVFSRARFSIGTSQRLGHIMMRAELDAVVCSGGRKGKHTTYALFDERVPPSAPVERDEALVQLARRYFGRRGPATPHDFSWWSGLTVSDAKRAIDLLGKEVQRVSVDGEDYWLVEREVPKAGPSAHLLPNYDEYFIGFKDRSAIGHRIGGTASVTGGNVLIPNVVVVDGQLVGAWKRSFEKTGAVVELDVVSKLTKREEARVATAARAFGMFLELPVTIR
jgi:hypothetical protein